MKSSTTMADKMAHIDKMARHIVEKERADREAKTLRLRAQRLAKEAHEAQPEEKPRSAKRPAIRARPSG